MIKDLHVRKYTLIRPYETNTIVTSSAYVLCPREWIETLPPIGLKFPSEYFNGIWWKSMYAIKTFAHV